MKKRILSMLLTVLMLVSLMPAMSITASADGETIVASSETAVTWEAGSYVVNNDVTITGGITVNGAVTLTIAKGKTLTVTNSTAGANGADAANKVQDGGAGGMGGNAITVATSGELTVCGSGTLNASCGTGGNGGTGGNTTGNSGDGGTGGQGGSGIYVDQNAKLTVNGCKLNLAGGDGGDGGQGGSGYVEGLQNVGFSGEGGKGGQGGS